MMQKDINWESQKMDTLVSQNLQRIESGNSGSVFSGFVDLDRMINGWHKSELIVIAGRPSMGKTSFAITCARNAAIDFNIPVALFTLESSSTHLVNRLTSIETEIDLEKIKRSSLEEWEWQQIHSKISCLEQAPILIDETPALDILAFADKCRKLKDEHNIQLIIVDYIQLMRGIGGDGKGIGERWQEIGSVTRGLKSIAKELNIPVIALSQLSRAVESRPGASKRPMLSDLADGGSIEQDADMVLFIYRPEYYGMEVDEDNNSTRRVAEVIVAKNRNGDTGIVRLKFVDKFVKFQDLDDSDDFPVPDNTFVGFKPFSDFEKPNNFIIRSTRMGDIDDEPPF